MTWSQAVAEATAILETKGVPEPSIDAWYLLEYVSGLTRTGYFLCQTEEMPEDILQKFKAVIERRAERIPLQHITGEQEFMGFSFHVSGDVLVPRQDTEILAEEALAALKGRSEAKVLDLCTGSGCLAVSIALLAEQAEVSACDLSEDALRTAQNNAQRLGAKVHFFRSDLLTALTSDEEFDMIVSNPPYIPSGDIPGLMEEVRLHDPMMALDGGADGLDFYREIARTAGAHLTPGGHLLLEIGAEQGQDVSDLLRENGYTDVQVVRDLSGLDRVVKGRL